MDEQLDWLPDPGSLITALPTRIGRFPRRELVLVLLDSSPFEGIGAVAADRLLELAVVLVCPGDDHPGTLVAEVGEHAAGARADLVLGFVIDDRSTDDRTGFGTVDLLCALEPSLAAAGLPITRLADPVGDPRLGVDHPGRPQPERGLARCRGNRSRVRRFWSGVHAHCRRRCDGVRDR